MASVASASAIRESAIARPVAEQMPTKFVFPAPEATREDYVDLLGLSEREFRLIKLRTGTRFAAVSYQARPSQRSL